MGEQPVRLTVSIWGDPDDFDRDGNSMSNLCDEIDACVLQYGFMLTDECSIVRGIDPLADDARLARERERAEEAFVAKQDELLQRGLGADDPVATREIAPYIERCVRTKMGYHA